MGDRCADLAGLQGIVRVASALYRVWYNFVTQQDAQRFYACNGAGLEDHLWSMTDLAEMIDARLPKPGKRGP